MKNKSEVSVNKAKCTSCGLCVLGCFVGALGFQEDGVPGYVQAGAKICAGCQHCMMLCPTGALSFGGLDPKTLRNPFFVDSDDMLDMIKSRRSMRVYKQIDVPQTKLDSLVEMLSYTPTAGNYNNLHFYIVSTIEKMNELRELTYSYISAMTPSSPIFYLKQIIMQNVREGKDKIFNGAPAMIVSAVDKECTVPGSEVVDPVIALSYFELYAQSLGLGTLWNGLATLILKNIPSMRQFLEIPERYELIGAMCFGEPAIYYKRMPHKIARFVKLL